MVVPCLISLSNRYPYFDILLRPTTINNNKQVLQNAHTSFRCFLAMEITPKLPSNLLRLGRCLVFEPAPGLRANLARTLSIMPASRMNKAPAERARLYFLLAWAHAITQERLRYVPLGWSKPYEFNEADLRCGLDTIDTWVDQVAMGRVNLPPSKLPFAAIYTLLAECVYGGKIDNAFDRRLLDTLLGRLFAETSFDADFRLIDSSAAGGETDAKQHVRLCMPETAVKREHYLNWVERMDTSGGLTGANEHDQSTPVQQLQQTPSWLGLPNSAEHVLLANRCSEVVAKLLRLAVLDEEDDDASVMAGEQQQQAQQQQQQQQADKFANQSDALRNRPLWIRQLHEATNNWLAMLAATSQTGTKSRHFSYLNPKK